MDIIDSAHGKHAHRFNARRKAPSSPLDEGHQRSVRRRITSLSWTLGLLEARLVAEKSPSMLRTSPILAKDVNRLKLDQLRIDRNNPATLEAIFERVPDEDLIHVVADLPRRLALIKPDEDLPHLNFLPYIEDSALLKLSREAFANQAAVEWNLYNRSKDDVFLNVCDVMTACWDDEVVSTVCSGLLCEFTSPQISIGTVIEQASHPFSSCHAILSRDTSKHCIPMSLQVLGLNAPARTGALFNLITSTSSTLEQLANYVVHCVAAIRAAWRTCQDLPQRFAANINEELAKRKRPETLEAALLHQAVTGSPFPEVREWLAEELQERGYKRWDSAVVNGYTQVIELVHTQLLPALDHAALNSSRLRGLSRKEPRYPLFDVETRYLTRIHSDLDSMRLISHRVLEYANTELQSFRSFSTWLHLQITIVRAEPNSTAANDAAEKAAGLDCGAILSYIEGPLMKSQLNYVLGRPTKEVCEALRRPGDQLKRWLLLRILTKHDKDAMQPKSRDEGGTVEAVNLLWQALMLRDSVAAVVPAAVMGFEHDTEVSGKILLEDHAFALQSPEGTRIGDMRMVTEVRTMPI